jgi:hypothetical protein
MSDTIETPTPEPSILASQANPAPVDPTPTPPPTPSLNPRPDYIPAKFWDESKGEPKLDQLGASYISLEKAFSSKREVKKPGADAKPEEIAAYQSELRKITGAPDKPEGYGLKAPDNLPEGVEWNAELANKAATIAHKYSVPPEALQELIALNNENVGGMMAKSAELQQVSYDTDYVGALNAEWKSDAPNNWQRATRGAAALGVDPSAFNPDADVRLVQRELAKATLGADRLIGEDSKLIGAESSQATYDERMDKLRVSDAYQGKLGPAKQDEAFKQMQQFYQASRA